MAFNRKENVQVVHRPGPLKQSNKPHKMQGKSSSKKSNKGKMGVKEITHFKMQNLKRQDRKNQIKQIRQNKRDAFYAKTRSFDSCEVPPLIVGIISLHPTLKASQFLEEMKECDDSLVVSQNNQGHCTISFPRQRQRFTFFIPENDIHSMLDTAKVSDTLLFLHASDEYEDYIETIMSIIIAHACPTTVHVLQGLDKLNPKKKAEIKKSVLKKIETWFPEQKLNHADTKQEFQLLLRQLGSQKLKSIGFRDIRPYVLADKIEFLPDNSEESMGTLIVSGYVRGHPLNVNRLIHIPGWDNYQMKKIVCETDPYGSRKEIVGSTNQVEIYADPELQESLVSEITPDPMDGEQTFPTDDDYDQGYDPSKEEKIIIKKKVVKGTSDYQAAWITHSDGEEISSGEESDSDAESMVTAEGDSMDEDMQDDESIKDESDEFEDANDMRDIEKYDKDIDMEEERKMLVRFREEQMEQVFPDEKDTPMDVPAKIRYQKYRGLRNFNDSPWDSKENLPLDYARIYQFANFRLTKKKILAEERRIIDSFDEPDSPQIMVLTGHYVTIHIQNVQQSAYDDIKNRNSTAVFGLLPHEQKMSVMNVVIKKHPICEAPIKSKDSLIFHIGFRRFVCQPIFSVNSSGNKFKFERYLPSKTAVVASFYAPTTFPPASVVVFQQQPNGKHGLVATGSLLNMNSERLVIKRIVLSGHPFRINQRCATVRYMFFNPEDINWFKCIELRTKSGRKGHIKEALGSHGHMKCVFDQQLQSQDITIMSLYKRVYPKWTYSPYVPTPCLPGSENLDCLFE